MGDSPTFCGIELRRKLSHLTTSKFSLACKLSNHNHSNINNKDNILIEVGNSSSLSHFTLLMFYNNFGYECHDDWKNHKRLEFKFVIFSEAYSQNFPVVLRALHLSCSHCFRGLFYKLFSAIYFSVLSSLIEKLIKEIQ